jgi:alpha-tubulin suppressor-like RCC1 family protein
MWTQRLAFVACCAAIASCQWVASIDDKSLAPASAGAGGGGGAGDPEVTLLAAGATFNCAVLQTGHVKCWGDNLAGELGLGDSMDRGAAPMQMGAQLPDVDLGAGRSAKLVASGFDHVCAVLDDDELKCWGQNDFGQLGQGDTRSRGSMPGQLGGALRPVDLGHGRSARAIALGEQFSCALLDDAEVKCWGINVDGTLGLGDTETRGDFPGEMGDDLPAVDLGAGRTAVAIACGAAHACAILDDGALKCWGHNLYGELGQGDTATRGDGALPMGDGLLPIALGSGRTAKFVAASQAHTCAVLDDATVKCWGYNDGRLGLGDTLPRGVAPGQMGDALPPVNLGPGRTARSISSLFSHTCVVLDDRQAKCWGSNGDGRLGVGTLNDHGAEPGQMGAGLPEIDLGSSESAKAVAAGGEHTCALLGSGRVKCWGDAALGQLGLGDVISRGGAPNEMGDALPVVEIGP